MPHRSSFLLCLALGLLGAPAQAQLPVDMDAWEASRADTVPPEPAPPQPPPDRWASRAELGFTGATGNTDMAVLATAFQIEHLQEDVFQLEWRVAFRYGESGGDVVARSLATSLSYDMRPRARFAPFVFGTGERDVFRRLDLRIDGGAGAKFTLVRAPAGEASLSAAGLFRYESFTDETGSDLATRWSLRARTTRTFGSNFKVAHTTYYRPVWDHFRDFDVHATTQISSKLTERLALTLTHEYLHDATPPAGVAREDQRFQAGITIDF